MENDKIVHNLNDEKLLKKENKKNKIVQIITIIIMSLILIGSVLFNSYYMYRRGYDDALDNFVPLTLETNHKKINRADINEVVEQNNSYLYPNVSFTNYYDSQSLNDYQYNSLINLVDDTTYIYYMFGDNDTIKFILTNGSKEYIIAIYEYTINGSNVDYVLQNTSDGYLHYIIGDTFIIYDITERLFPNLFISYMPNYSSVVSTTPLLLSVGGNNGAINYEQGYNTGYYEGINNVLTNPNGFGLYNNNQLINYGDERESAGYIKGFNDAENGIEQHGFIVLMNTIFNAPYNIFSGFLNFEIFGINLFNFLSFIFTTTLAFFIVKLIFLKR